MVQREFTAGMREQAHIGSLLELAEKRLESAGGVLKGELRRFGDARDPGRYLLITTVRTGNDAPRRILLIVLSDSGGVSRAQPWSVGAGLDNFIVALVQDIDGDSLPDLAYCYRGPQRSDSFEMRAAGFRDGRWYQIASVPRDLAECPREEISP
jgi:hypothetical protein